MCFIVICFWEGCTESPLAVEWDRRALKPFSVQETSSAAAATLLQCKMQAGASCLNTLYEESGQVTKYINVIPYWRAYCHFNLYLPRTVSAPSAQNQLLNTHPSLFQQSYFSNNVLLPVCWHGNRLQAVSRCMVGTELNRSPPPLQLLGVPPEILPS